MGRHASADGLLPATRDVLGAALRDLRLDFPPPEVARLVSWAVSAGVFLEAGADLSTFRAVVLSLRWRQATDTRRCPPCVAVPLWRFLPAGVMCVAAAYGRLADGSPSTPPIATQSVEAAAADE